MQVEVAEEVKEREGMEEREERVLEVEGQV